jgi:DNA-binding phage protein
VKRFGPVCVYNGDPLQFIRGPPDQSRYNLDFIELSSYNLSDYHLHPEAKFLNADYFDRGRTVRQPVRAAAIELIGKEANRWEEQFFLGEDEEAQIVYAVNLDCGRFHKRLAHFVGFFGLARVAQVAGASRPSLTRLYKDKAKPTTQMHGKLEEAFAILQIREANEHSRNAAVLALLRQRAADRGVNQLAADLGIDRRNLSALLAGRRPVPRKLWPR